MRVKHVAFWLLGVLFALIHPAHGHECARSSGDKDPIATNRAFDLYASLVGGEWRIDNRGEDGQLLRARSVFKCGPGKRFVIAQTFVIGDDGKETWDFESVFAPIDSHVVKYGFASDGSVQTVQIIYSKGTAEGAWVSKGSKMRQTVKLIDHDKIAWEIAAQAHDGQWRRILGGVWHRE